MPYCGCQLKDSAQTKASNFQMNFPNNVIISVERQTEGNKNKEREWALKVTKYKQQMVLHNWQKGKSKEKKNPFMKGAKPL